MPAVGSSRNTSAGSCTNAAASARRRCMPPDTSRTFFLRCSSSSTHSRTWRRRTPAAQPQAVHRGVEAEVLPQRQLGEQRRQLRHVADPLALLGRRAWSPACPTRRAGPRSGSSSPVSRRTVVVLPHPLGPISPTIDPASIRRSTPERTRSSPKRLAQAFGARHDASPAASTCSSPDAASVRAGARRPLPSRDRPANPRVASAPTMGLQSLERRLERMVEGVFRGSRSAIRPIELGRRVVREMDDQRSVDVKGRRIVPNDFPVYLSPRDLHCFDDIHDVLQRRARRGGPRVRPRGGLPLHGPGARRAGRRPRAPRRPLQGPRPAQQARGGAGAGSPRAAVGPAGLARRPRRSRSAAARTAPSRSTTRTSAAATPRCAPGTRGYVVVDLGSTNGTMVNGTRISAEQPLVDGDILSFGATYIRFEAS